MTTETKLVVQLDASGLKHTDCFLKFYRKIVCGYRGKDLDAGMEYGSAYHKFRETLAITHDPDTAVKVAQTYFLEKSVDKNFSYKKGKEWLNVAHLTVTCKAYLDKFGTGPSYGDFNPLVVDGKPLVEQTFALPFYNDDKIDVLLCGTIDEIGKLENGCYAICDDKTTSSWNRESYLNEHRMKVQLRFYVFAIHQLGKLYPDSIFAEMAQQRIGSAINGVFLSASKQTEFKRSDFFFYKQEDMEEMDEFLKNLCIILSCNLVPTIRQGIYNDACSGKFATPCDFIGVCQAPAEVRQQMLDNSFVKSEYSPLSFRK